MKSPGRGAKRGVRRSEEEITALLSEYKASKQRVSEFARARQLPAQSVYGWLRARGESAKGSQAAGFASVVVRTGVGNGSGVVTLRAALGWSVEVSGVDAQYVATLFKALLPCSR